MKLYIRSATSEPNDEYMNEIETTLFDEYIKNDEFPTYQEFCDEFYDIDSATFKTAVQNVNKSIISADLSNNVYDEYLQLHDNRTLYKLDNESKDEIDYGALLEQAFEKFEEITGVEAFTLGRSNRHVCVDLTYENVKNYVYLKDTALQLENWVVEEFNSSDD